MPVAPSVLSGTLIAPGRCSSSYSASGSTSTSCASWASSRCSSSRSIGVGISVLLEQVAEDDPAGLDRLRQRDRLAGDVGVGDQVLERVLSRLEEVENAAAALEARPAAARGAGEDDGVLRFPPGAVAGVGPHPHLAAAD